MNPIALTLFVCSIFAAPAWSQTAKPMTSSELATYSGADRERLLFDGAKREGKLVWYTTLATDQNKQITAAFEKKYQGVTVDTYRTGSSALAQRLLTEAKARRHIADAIETTPGGMMTFRESQLLLPYTSPHLAVFPEDAKERAAKNTVMWTIVRESYVGFGYNKRYLNAADVPKDFEGLLKPALRDNLGIAGEDTGARIIGAMVKTKGLAWVRRLKEQNIRMHMMAGSALTQLVAAGEIYGSPSQFFSATNVAARRGAPVAWVPLDLVVASAGGAAVYVNAPRPHAALLFVDFLMSPEGQKIYEDLFFGVTHKDYGFKRWYPEKGGTVAQYEESLDGWHRLLKEIARKGT
ncbi:MAG: extracellular solute-binding protein [Deltaproteobacteria bacterium]|nr:extracellular solute-binding protein [Deltaproteobacteria bacterium]